MSSHQQPLYHIVFTTTHRHPWLRTVPVFAYVAVTTKQLGGFPLLESNTIPGISGMNVWARASGCLGCLTRWFAHRQCAGLHPFQAVSPVSSLVPQDGLSVTHLTTDHAERKPASIASRSPT